MGKSTVYFKGIDALQKGLKDRATLSDVKKVVALNGTEMTEQAKRNAPVRTGDLKGSIAMDIIDDGMTAKTSAAVDYAPYVEKGTRFMSAQPYMKPAHNTQAPQFIKDLERLTK